MEESCSKYCPQHMLKDLESKPVCIQEALLLTTTGFWHNLLRKFDCKERSDRRKQRK